MRRRAFLLLAALLAALGPVPADALERVRGVVHIHSDLTTGDFTLEGLVALAERQSIGALLLAENYRLRVDYGLPPFRALTRVSRHGRSIGGDPAGFLARVAEAQARMPHVVLVPGVEIMPHYHWTGSPLALDLTVHNLQKNLLVFGIADPATLARLPAPGNPATGVYALQSALDALPVLLVVPGVLLLRRRRLVRQRLGRGAVMVVRRRSWKTGALCCLVGVVALVRGWPFTVERHPWWQDAGMAPYQEVIDRAEALGGVTMWSFPEARDIGEEYAGPVRVGWLTEPYADDLLRTFRYTGFGAIYEDTSTFERAGAGWDRALAEYARGERTRAPWALAESGFHGLTANKQVGPLQTVFLVEQKSAAGILDAFRRGRMYAVQRTRELGFDLADFTVRGGGAAAGAGETLRVPAGTPVELSVAIEASDGRAHDVRMAIIANGRVVALERGGAPLRATYRTTTDGTPLILRVEARGSQQRVLSNPVFIRP
jgi:hypothetical protein